MKYLRHLNKIIIMFSLLGLLVACGDHTHEETVDGEKKKEHGHSHD